MAVRIGAEVRRADRQIILPNGGEVSVRSADNPDSLRGDSLDFLVIDECALIQEEAWTEALRPALADRRGRALFISTPKGHNWFWRLFQQGQQESGEVKSWQFPTSNNPYIDPAEIEAARVSLPERIFQQEFLAMFVQDSGGVFRRVMEAATVTALKEARGSEYVMGVDWGKHNDFTAIAVVDIRTGAVVALDRFNQIDYRVQTQRLKAMADRFRPFRIIAEQNAMGEPLIEQLRRDGLPVRGFVTTNASKEIAIEALALAFERGEIAIPNDPVLIAELQAYEMTRLPGGMVRYSAPGGMHDDTVMSLALAWQGANTKQTRITRYAS
jgi:phage terminase large subunit-like protein